MNKLFSIVLALLFFGCDTLGSLSDSLSDSFDYEEEWTFYTPYSSSRPDFSERFLNSLNKPIVSSLRKLVGSLFPNTFKKRRYARYDEFIDRNGNEKHDQGEKNIDKNMNEKWDSNE